MIKTKRALPGFRLQRSFAAGWEIWIANVKSINLAILNNLLSSCWVARLMVFCITWRLDFEYMDS